MTRHLVLWFEQRSVGDFRQLADGRQEFQYHETWCDAIDGFAISLALPRRREPFGNRETRAFFGGLLPDDEVRKRLARHLQVSWHNEFALLAEVGRECAGALALWPPELRPTVPGRQPPQPIDDVALARLLRDLPQRPLLAGGELRLSLAGAQDKIAVVVHGGAIALPPVGMPSTHILKVPIANFAATVANEFFSMQLAAAAGLVTPPTSMRIVDGMPILLVERFDRVRTPDGIVQRRHQEDFCQALGVPPELKYQAEGGPGLPAIFELLTAHSTRAALDRLALLQMVFFHFLLGNADAHAKNFSLLLGVDHVRLAPVYDAMCTLVYPSLSSRLAMKIDKHFEFDEITVEHWEAFARTVGLAPGMVRRRLEELAATLPDLARSVAARHPEIADEPIVGSILACIGARCRAVLGQLRPGA